MLHRRTCWQRSHRGWSIWIGVAAGSDDVNIEAKCFSNVGARRAVHQ